MIENLIDSLRNVAEVYTECGPGEFSQFDEVYAKFLETYPQLARFQDYLAFLRMTGGAYITHARYSLVINGFGGDVATSFDEPRSFLDRDRYFHFADVVLPLQGGAIKVFAFDLNSDLDTVYVTDDGVWVYEQFSDSFCAMLKNFVDLAE